MGEGILNTSTSPLARELHSIRAHHEFPSQTFLGLRERFVECAPMPLWLDTTTCRQMQAAVEERCSVWAANKPVASSE